MWALTHNSACSLLVVITLQFVCGETTQSSGLSAVQCPREASHNEGKALIACAVSCSAAELTLNLISITLYLQRDTKTLARTEPSQKMSLLYSLLLLWCRLFSLEM